MLYIYIYIYTPCQEFDKAVGNAYPASSPTSLYISHIRENAYASGVASKNQGHF